MSRYLTPFLFAFIFISSSWTSSYSAPATPVQEYRALNKTDPRLKKISAWVSVKEKLKKYVAKNPRAKDTTAAIFALAQINEKLFTADKKIGSLKEAESAYERIARKYPKDVLVDDALLELGDLRRGRLKDEIGAKSAYYEIIDLYPSGDRIAEARSRLAKKAATETVAVQNFTSVKAKNTKESTADAVAAKVEKPLKAEPKKIDKTESEEEHSKPSFSATPSATPTPVLPGVPVPPKPGSGLELVNNDELSFKRPLIVIDPGHGGEDFGAKGVDGVLEKNVVLSIAMELDELLKERLRAKTFLTRSTDVFIPLADRTQLANDKSADLFISIHANASEYRTAQGVETYYLDNTKEKSSLRLAERENASLNFGKKADNKDADISFILSDLIQNVKLDDSISLAHMLQNNLHGTLSRYYEGVVNLGVKKAPFYVLVGAHMPCILVEVSFIDHPLEGKRLGEERYQRFIAQALYEGVKKFFVKRER